LKNYEGVFSLGKSYEDASAEPPAQAERPRADQIDNVRAR
jgi:hypothetical protein